MSTKSKKSKIIFINSFKGGAGKTTLSLAKCINSLFGNEDPYSNVIYMDLDIQGTGTSFLFSDNVLTEEKCFENTGEAAEVELEYEHEKRVLYVAFLNPASKIHSVYYGDTKYINHQGIADEMFKRKVLEYIKKIKGQTDTLFVLDCAPGYTRIEQDLLYEFYNMGKNEIDVEEYYVTTVDSAHIKKCIQCLRESRTGIPIPWSQRNVNIVINNIQNYGGNEDEKTHRTINARWNRIARRIKREIGADITICKWEYSQKISAASVYGEEWYVQNMVDDYIFTKKNYVRLISKNRAEG